MTDRVYQNGVEQADLFLEYHPDSEEWSQMLTLEAVKVYCLGTLKYLHETEQKEVWDAWLETDASYQFGELTPAGEASFPRFAEGFITTIQAVLEDIEDV